MRTRTRRAPVAHLPELVTIDHRTGDTYHAAGGRVRIRFAAPAGYVVEVDRATIGSYPTLDDARRAASLTLTYWS